jgi:hypothetical protein
MKTAVDSGWSNLRSCNFYLGCVVWYINHYTGEVAHGAMDEET